MAASTNHWKLGLFVVSGLLVAFGSIVWLGAARFNRLTRRVYTYFDESVQGLEVGSPIKFRGVTVGTVAAITVAPDRRHVQVAADVYLDVLEDLGLRQPGVDLEERMQKPFVPPGVRVQLVSSGLTGVKFLQVDYFDPEEHPLPDLPFPVPWAYIPATSSTLKSLEESLTQTLDRLPALGDKVSGLIVRIEGILEEADVPALSRQARSLMATAERKLDEADVAAISDETKAFLDEAERTLTSLRRFVARLESEDGEVMRLVARLQGVAGALETAIQEAKAGETAASLRATSESFGGVARDATGLSDELAGTLRALREASEAVRELATLLQRDPGALLHGQQPGSPPPVGGR